MIPHNTIIFEEIINLYLIQEAYHPNWNTT